MSIGLLLGAGFSYDFGMPLAKEFTKALTYFLNIERMNSLINGMKKASPYGEDHPMDETVFDEFFEIYCDFIKDQNNNYEEFFRKIENLRLADNEKNRSRHYFLGKLEDIINESFLIFQKNSHKYYIVNRELYLPFFKKHLEEDVWIFTLNHDICLEMLCIDYNLPFTYGTNSKICFPVSNTNMGTRISFDILDSTETNINNLDFCYNDKIKIIKLHGGLNEFTNGDETSGRKRIFVSSEGCKRSLDYLKRIETVWHGMEFLIDGQKLPVQGELCVSDLNGEMQFIQPSILTGSKKYSSNLKVLKSEEKMPLFSMGLEKLNKLYVIGYSFGDYHINMRLQKAMFANDKLQVAIVNPSVEKQAILDPFDYDNRVSYYNISTLRWMDYEMTKKWDKELEERLDISSKYIRKAMIEDILKTFIR